MEDAVPDNSEPEIDLERLQQRIKENPNDAAAYSALGYAYLVHRLNQEEVVSLEMNRQAALAYEKALRLDPDDSTAELALCMLITGVEPSVKPSEDLLRFLDAHGGSIVRIAQASGGIPRLTEVKPPDEP